MANSCGTPGRIRTYDLELRSLLLYPAELPGQTNPVDYLSLGMRYLPATKLP